MVEWIIFCYSQFISQLFSNKPSEIIFSVVDNQSYFLFQLEDGYKVFDYNINLNDVVILMVKPDVSAFQSSKVSDEKLESESTKPSVSKEVVSMVKINFLTNLSC